MSYPIKFLSLQKAELEYEVALRGGSGDSVEELRKQIVKLSQLNASEDITESHLEPSDDLKAVKESLLKTHNFLLNLKTKFDKNLYVRTETLLNHLYHRINRITNVPEVADIYKVCVSNWNQYFKDLNALKPQIPSTRILSTSDTTPEPTTISVSCERSLSADIGKLKYSGKTCVHSFILKVEEFVQSRGISFEKILSLAFEIFTDDALHWYRYKKDTINSWSELCTLLKQDFSSSDYDYKLTAEIRMRTQGEQENIIVYVSIMHGLFSRLCKPLSEESKLDILLHNIRPCYANTLAATPEIKSIDALVSSCRHYENVKSRFSQFHEPPKISTNTLAPEYAYKSYIYTNKNFENNKQKYYNYNLNTNSNKQNPNPTYQKEYTNYKQNLINSVDAVVAGPSRPIYCPRCRTDNHSLRNCTAERVVVCFKCGMKDYRYPECPKCNPPVNMNQKN